MAHVAQLRVIYGDTDQMGVVYYANYLRFFEVGRVEWLRHQGLDYRDFEREGLFLPVIEAHANYRSPARYDDLLLIEARLTRAKWVTVRFEYTVRRGGDGATLCEGWTVHAAIGRDGKPRRLPTTLQALFRAQIEVAADVA